MKFKLAIYFAVILAAMAAGASQLVMEPVTTTVSAQGAASAIVLTTQGTLPASGAYVHTTGNFIRVVEGTPLPSPSPTATPPCIPSPGSPGGTLYIGQYQLSNGENGSFSLNVETGSNSAAGAGAPLSFPQNPTVVEQGPLGMTAQIDTTTGMGTANLSFTSQGTPITGTVTFFTSFAYPPTEPVVCGTPTPTPTPSGTATPTPTPQASPTPPPSPTPTPSGPISISGRVLTPIGLPVRNTPVILTNSATLARLTATTSSFGTYTINNVPPNQQYILNAQSKRFRFTPLIFTPTTSQTNVDLIGQE